VKVIKINERKRREPSLNNMQALYFNKVAKTSPQLQSTSNFPIPKSFLAIGAMGSVKPCTLHGMNEETTGQVSVFHIEFSFDI
jgi:hypothetical protein